MCIWCVFPTTANFSSPRREDARRRFARGRGSTGRGGASPCCTRERRRFDRSTSPLTARRWPSRGRTRGDDSSSPPGTSVSRASAGRRRRRFDTTPITTRGAFAFRPSKTTSSSRAAEIPSARIAFERENSGARASTSATSTCERPGRARRRTRRGETPSRRRPPIRNSRRWRLRPRPSTSPNRRRCSWEPPRARWCRSITPRDASSARTSCTTGR